MILTGRIPGRKGLWEIQLQAANIVAMGCIDAGFAGVETDWITPGLFDIQVNGCLGIDFADPKITCESLAVAEGVLGKHGISLYCPTVVTRDKQSILGTLAVFDKAWDRGLIPRAMGIHLEGPYISSLDGYRGVHQSEFVRDPDWDEFTQFQECCGGRIRMVTLAPERPRARSFIEKAVASGVIVAIGHTAAEDKDIAAAVDCGATISTHLFNGSAQLIDRHRNVIYAQLAEDRLYASLIADGHHIPLSTFKVAVRAKGVDRVILASDLTYLAGLPEGEYTTENRSVVMRDSGVWVKDAPLLAGAATTLERDVEILARQPEPGIEAALLCATRVPAQALKCEDLFELEAGRTGPLVVFGWRDGKLEIKTRIGF